MNYRKFRSFRFVSQFCRFDNRLSQKDIVCVVFTDFNTQNYILFQSLSLWFILTIFLKFRKFQPRYAYKIYYLKKECN